MALKLDMDKAYDRVEWEYVGAILAHIGFSSQWISWIIMLISSVNYSFCSSGKIFGSISPGRGLHPGDPLSLYFLSSVLKVYLRPYLIWRVRD